jgi:porin
MKRPIAPLLCTCIAITLLSMPAGATPLPQQSPFEPSPQNVPPPPGPQNLPSAETPQPGMPELPTTGATSSMPEGLGNAPLSMWKQDHLTGDWDGFRDEMLNHGVALTPTWIGEVFGNPSGGAGRGLISDGLLNFALDIDPDRMSDSPVFDDMLIHANALYIYGASLSGSFVGDFSNTSNIAGYNSVRLQELWLQKQFWEKRVSVKVGNIAVDTEFFQSSSAALFINGTFGAFTFIASNVPNAPVYPLASPGVRISFTPTSRFYVMAGVFGLDNGSDPTINNKNGDRFALNAASGMLVMSEAGYLVNQSPNDRGLQGTYRIGSWLDTGNFQTFDSQANQARHTGFLQSGGADYGVYGVMDQQIYLHGAQAISLFVRSGGAPSNTNFVDYYAEGGFNFTGFVPGRFNDVAGIAVARSHVSNNFSDASVLEGGLPYTAETVIEATYKVQLNLWWTVQPDIQYIITPSGSQYSHNATVLGLRSSIAF